MKNVIDDQVRANLRKAFGDCIRSLRGKKGISQDRLWLETGTGRAYMSGLERGQHSPSIETIYKLLVGLGVTWAEFGAEFERCFAKANRRRNKNRT